MAAGKGQIRQGLSPPGERRFIVAGPLSRTVFSIPYKSLHDEIGRGQGNRHGDVFDHGGRRQGDHAGGRGADDSDFLKAFRPEKTDGTFKTLQGKTVISVVFDIRRHRKTRAAPLKEPPDNASGQMVIAGISRHDNHGSAGMVQGVIHAVKPVGIHLKFPLFHTLHALLSESEQGFLHKGR